jgi:hypothetical protein
VALFVLDSPLRLVRMVRARRQALAVLVDCRLRAVAAVALAAVSAAALVVPAGLWARQAAQALRLALLGALAARLAKLYLGTQT